MEPTQPKRLVTGRKGLELALKIEKFLGIRNTVPAQSLKAEELAAAVNVDLDDDGKRVRRRGGTQSLQPGAKHSLWSGGGVCLYRQDDKLYRVNPGLTTSTIVGTGLGRFDTEYVAYDGTVYLSDRVSALRLRDGVLAPWGIMPPTVQPAAAVTGGSLPKGRYQYAVTYVRADGEESGTGRARVIDAEGGIRFTAIPVSPDPSVRHKSIYLTLPDAKTLKRAFLVAPNVTDVSFAAGALSLGVSLETMFKQPPPAGQVLAEHNGRIVVAVGEHLLYSDPYLPERFEPIRQVHRFESAITIVAPVGDGVFVGTEQRVRFLVGADIASATEIVKADYGALPGSLDYCASQDLGGKTEDRCAVFGTERGVCYGFPGGTLLNRTLDNYRFPTAKRGAGIVIHDQGRKRYVLAFTR